MLVLRLAAAAAIGYAVTSVSGSPHPNCPISPEEVDSLYDVFYRMVHPGMLSNHEGTASLVNRGRGDDIFAVDVSWLNKMQKLCKSKLPSEIKKTFESPAYAGKGYSCLIEGHEVSTLHNPKNKANYKKAYEHFSNELSNGFWSLSEEDMILQIKQIHTFLFDKIDIEGKPGQYRSSQMVILGDDGVSFEDLIASKLPLLSKKDQKTILSILGDRDRFERLSEKDRKQLNKLAPVCPAWQKVDRLMQAFVKELKKRKEEGEDPIALAAFAHQRIGEIHPFVDGNGRVSRIVMNAILAQEGYPPVVFDYDSEYTEKVAQGIQAFTSYMRDKISTMCSSTELKEL